MFFLFNTIMLLSKNRYYSKESVYLSNVTIAYDKNIFIEEIHIIFLANFFEKN